MTVNLTTQNALVSAVDRLSGEIDCEKDYAKRVKLYDTLNALLAQIRKASI